MPQCLQPQVKKHCVPMLPEVSKIKADGWCMVPTGTDDFCYSQERRAPRAPSIFKTGEVDYAELQFVGKV